MSAELRARFTADATDFNAAVRGIEGRMRGLSGLTTKLGAGGLGRGIGSIGALVGGVGMGVGTAGLGASLAAVATAARSMTEALEDRAKRIEQGLPVQELTPLGERLSTFSSNVEFVGRGFKNIGVLLTQGVDAWVNSINQVGIWSEDLAKTLQEQAEQAKKAKAKEAMIAEARARGQAQLEDFVADNIAAELEATRAAEREADARNLRVLETLDGIKRDNQIKQIEKSGDFVRADAMRLQDQLNAMLGPGATPYSLEDTLRMAGGDLAMARELAAPQLPAQFAPELTDRLTAIGGLSGRAADGTPREMLSAEKQQVDLQKRILETLQTSGGTVLR